MADCRARGRADIERLPVKPAKKAKPQRHGVAHWIERDGCIWLVRRPEKGMLGGMRALTGGERSGATGESAFNGSGIGTVDNGIPHFELRPYGRAAGREREGKR